MPRAHLFDRRASEDDRVLDDEIESIPGVHMKIAIADWKLHVGVEAHGETFRQDGMKKHAGYALDSASSAVGRRSRNGSQS